MRKVTNLNDGWQFTGPDGGKAAVNLPHTWNHKDGQDGGNDYWRGTCKYEKDLQLPEFQKKTEQVYLEFRGVNASAVVFLNGVRISSHDGGYSTFRVEITDLLDQENHLVVEVDNSVNTRVYPQKADFTFYGGIYRDVNLLVVNRKHFDLEYCGEPGIRVTPEVNGKDGCVRIQTFLDTGSAMRGWEEAAFGRKDAQTGDAEQEVRLFVLDVDGAIVAESRGVDDTLLIPDVHLWNGTEDPYLYTAVAQLYWQGKLVDEIKSRFGVRSFCADPQKGFFLNGKRYPLRGVSRHQDWKGLGNAIGKEHHRRDMELIREIGANTVRLAHYQHDQYFYDLCDEYGMIVWAEIPYISEHMPEGRSNTISQAKELVVQNYNHPCIVCWGVSNEITISTKDKEDMLDNHRVLHELYHRMDETRLTTLACYAMCGPFNRSAHITDLVSWNLYLGWYVPGLFLNDLWMRFFHFCFPNRCLGYSEYGCEAMTNLHAAKPRRGDHTEEYQAVYHEYMLKCFERNPYLWATHVWNMFDFAADARDQGGEPGMNHKGLVTFDRRIKKDSFYLYKAYWSQEPFVHIAGKRRRDREETNTTIKVYSNQSEVALYVNGKLTEIKQGSRVYEFQIPLSGTVEIMVQTGACEDRALFHKVQKPNPDYKLVKGKSSSANWV
ncbi:MAG: glycoside hydrolase family 2 TIM barrel-domain containing protein [Eubacteriales bacterium]|nr:glycoside hydrolase family 2 TIM barrel-domain containing protein [Eubacteriales bacterium]